MENWKRTLDVNLFGAYFCAHSAIPFLKQRGAGKIITIGSNLGHRGYAGGSAYSCSKAGLSLFLASQPDIGPTAQSFSLMRRDN